MATRSAWLATALFALAFGPPSLQAEPITITSGTVQAAVTIGSARITLNGEGFELRTGSEDFFSDLRFWPIPVTTPVNLAATWRPTGRPVARAVVNGVTYPRVFLDVGTFGHFGTPSVSVSEPGLTIVTLPFGFTGFLNAFDAEGEDVPLFSVQLVGRGTARASILVQPGEGGLPPVYYPDQLYRDGTNIEYLFSEPPAPVPEPGTLLLLGSGALVIAARRRLRRRSEIG